MQRVWDENYFACLFSAGSIATAGCDACFARRYSTSTRRYPIPAKRMKRDMEDHEERKKNRICSSCSISGSREARRADNREIGQVVRCKNELAMGAGMETLKKLEEPRSCKCKRQGQRACASTINLLPYSFMNLRGKTIATFVAPEGRRNGRRPRDLGFIMLCTCGYPASEHRSASHDHMHFVSLWDTY